MADTRLIAGNTGSNVIEPPFAGLIGHFGVADHRSGHTAHVRLARAQQLLRFLRLIDAAGDKDRLGYAVTQFPQNPAI